ncbi:unnamed protein product [Protopolystoma xenopodis]|uniref:Uncharacterized protein n=1 Tax=Protopolystoma xenopodis TaxID=117903 RepID=A0A3S5BPH7_9PLAT|nr:unnamed protein product [Protopolystoma xenopodis]
MSRISLESGIKPCTIRQYTGVEDKKTDTVTLAEVFQPSWRYKEELSSTDFWLPYPMATSCEIHRIFGDPNANFPNLPGQKHDQNKHKQVIAITSLYRHADLSVAIGGGLPWLSIVSSDLIIAV